MRKGEASRAQGMDRKPESSANRWKVATDAGSDVVGKTATVSAEAAGEAAGAFVSMIKVEKINS